MFSLIPINLYTPLYYFVILLLVFVTSSFAFTEKLNSYRNITYMKVTGIVLMVFIILYMGLRPIHGVFVDMMTYNNRFINFQIYGGSMLDKPTDYLFDLFTLLCSKVMSAEMYFFTCAALYVIPLWLACKKWFKNYAFYCFLLLVASFTFWNFGTNGIRNGLATSFFIYAVSREKLTWKVVYMLIAINLHKTMLLPTVGYLTASFYNHPKKFLFFWLMCIPLSLTFGKGFQTFLAGLIDDGRASYLTEEASSSFSSTGFRWDFLIYSSTAVFAGWYYLFKLNFKDKAYSILFCTYLFANAFWILVIQANFSNRFAYLSWCMMAIIIVYPLLKRFIIAQQHVKIGYIILSYFAFTFFMNVIIA